MLIRAEGRGIWGDGFVDDELSAMRTASDWAAVERDEYIRLFPALLPVDGRTPAAIAAALRGEVARRATRLNGDARPAFALARLAAWVLGPAREGMAPGEMAPEGDAAEAMTFLDEVLGAAQAGPLGVADPAVTARFAFLSGIHPAYLWPSALATHERDAAAGWLGVVARGRPALMPADVADLLLDLIDVAPGRPIACRDAQMAGFMRAATDLATLWRAARARRAGQSPVVRRAPLMPRALRAVTARRPAAVRRWPGAGIDLLRKV